MALPPGFSGWVGSGFDCTCECGFIGGFYYAGNLPDDFTYVPPPTCLLMFAVGQFRDGCTPFDAATADITIELTLNGSALGEDAVYSSANESYIWQTWEPEAGDVYGATVTLTCGTTITIREYEYTIPDPANTACDCCDEWTPDYAIVSGLTSDCCSIGNGTYALSAISTCITEKTNNYSAPATEDRCNDAVACKTITLTTRLDNFPFPPLPFDVAYLHKQYTRVTVGIGRDPEGGGFLPNPDTIRVTVAVGWFAYRKRYLNDSGTGSGEFECTPVGGYSNGWTFEATCSTQFQLIDSDATDPTVCPSDAPNFELVFL